MTDRYTLPETPLDHTFSTSNGEELCHATGDCVYLDGEWWYEYEDSDGVLHYGR